MIGAVISAVVWDRRLETWVMEMADGGNGAERSQDP